MRWLSLFLACQQLNWGTNLRECEDQSWFKVQASPVCPFHGSKIYISKIPETCPKRAPHNAVRIVRCTATSPAPNCPLSLSLSLSLTEQTRRRQNENTQSPPSGRGHNPLLFTALSCTCKTQSGRLLTLCSPEFDPHHIWPFDYHNDSVFHSASPPLPSPPFAAIAISYFNCLGDTNPVRLTIQSKIFSWIWPPSLTAFWLS
jgi:hypothetical protein